jgi:hypothetical protein
MACNKEVQEINSCKSRFSTANVKSKLYPKFLFLGFRRNIVFRTERNSRKTSDCCDSFRFSCGFHDNTQQLYIELDRFVLSKAIHFLICCGDLQVFAIFSLIPDCSQNSVYCNKKQFHGQKTHFAQCVYKIL